MSIAKLYSETERLFIRPFETEDYENWFRHFNNRLPSQYKYDDGRPSSMSLKNKEWFANWIQGFDQAAKDDKMYNLGIFRKEDGANIGKVELFTILRMDYQWAMMGYSIHNQFWNKGYGKESVLAASELFFNELCFHRIELHINIDNHPSIKLAENTGYQYECTREKFSMENKVWTDFLIYYKNREK